MSENQTCLDHSVVWTMTVKEKQQEDTQRGTSTSGSGLPFVLRQKRNS